MSKLPTGRLERFCEWVKSHDLDVNNQVVWIDFRAHSRVHLTVTVEAFERLRGDSHVLVESVENEPDSEHRKLFIDGYEVLAKFKKGSP